MQISARSRATAGASPALPAALRRSLACQAHWLRDGLRAELSGLPPRNARRLLTLTGLLPPFITLQALHWLGFAADALAFRQEADTPVDTPLFVVGIPRSGTTFVHRLLAEDRQQFTTLTTWQAVLAPSVSERRFWQGCGRIDGWLGQPGKRLRDRVLRTLGADMADIHAVGADAAEEDYLLLLPMAACFLLVLAFPESRSLWQLAAMHRLPVAERRLLLHAYARCLQKHLHASGGGRRLLSKNAAFASWTGALADHFPDARFIVCLREPDAALRSQLSAVAPGRRLFGTAAPNPDIGRGFAQAFASGYRHLADQLDAHPERMVAVDMDDLNRAPGATLRAALAHLQVPVSAAINAALAGADTDAATRTSNHAHHVHAIEAPSLAQLRRMRRDYQRMQRHCAGSGPSHDIQQRKVC